MIKIAALLEDIRLRPHQEEAVQFILSGKKGSGLLAHDPGTGKTLSSIAAFEEIAKEDSNARALVITPASLRTNFAKSGIGKFTDSSYSEGVDGRSKYQIESLERFRRNPSEFIDKSGATHLIVDEIHRAKDPSSLSNKALREASSNSQIQGVIGLTGSFINNHPKEVVTLLDIIDDSHGFGSQDRFGKRYTKREQYEKGGFLKKPKSRIELVKRDEIARNIDGLLHYADTEDMGGDIPSMEVRDIHVPMSKEQQRLYNFAMGKVDPVSRARIREGLPVNQTEANHILSAIMKARQASNSISTHKDIPHSESARRTPKIKRVLDDIDEHIKNTKDGQAVVYTNMIYGGVDVLEAGLKDRGYNPGLFTGTAYSNVTKDSRDRDVEDFKSGKNNVIILTPAAKEGVSLDNATGFFEVDRFYNPERNNQAIARARRIGGQSHRKKEDRLVEVNRYYSDPNPGLIDSLLGRRPVGVDEWIGIVAKEKERLNNDMRSTVKGKRREV